MTELSPEEMEELIRKGGAVRYEDDQFNVDGFSVHGFSREELEELKRKEKLAEDNRAYDIADKARKLVYGDRNEVYGNPTDDFSRTGRMWGAILGLPNDVPPEKVALMMAAVKLSRLCQSPEHLDSQVDTIGYMLCYNRVINDV